MARASSKLAFANPAPWFGREREPGGAYRGLRMMSDTGLHAQLACLIVDLCPLKPHGPPARILDLGCGEGALAQRLHDLGYEVVAADVRPEPFHAKGPRFVQCDFNDASFAEVLLRSHAGGFDGVVACEVIEHLRNPWEFLAGCRRVCGPETHLLLSTPNVASWWSRFWFLLTGDWWGFQHESWSQPGHIRPITATEMTHLLRENGFECLRVISGGRLPIVWAYNWKRFLISLAMLPWRLVMRGPVDGWNLIFHAKPMPDRGARA